MDGSAPSGTALEARATWPCSRCSRDSAWLSRPGWSQSWSRSCPYAVVQVDTLRRSNRCCRPVGTAQDAGTHPLKARDLHGVPGLHPSAFVQSFGVGVVISSLSRSFVAGVRAEAVTAAQRHPCDALPSCVSVRPFSSRRPCARFVIMTLMSMCRSIFGNHLGGRPRRAAAKRRAVSQDVNASFHIGLGARPRASTRRQRWSARLVVCGHEASTPQISNLQPQWLLPGSRTACKFSVGWNR